MEKINFTKLNVFTNLFIWINKRNNYVKFNNLFTLLYFRKTGRYDESEDMLRKCLLLEPTFAPAYVEMSKLLGADHSSLYKILKNAFDLKPNDPFYGIQLGHFLARNGNEFNTNIRS